MLKNAYLKNRPVVMTVVMTGTLCSIAALHKKRYISYKTVNKILDDCPGLVEGAAITITPDSVIRKLRK